MALISLKSRKDPIEVPNEKAKAIKARWGGLDAPKASDDDIIDLDWITFTFGQLKTIEITNTRKIYEEDEYDRPLTAEERKERDSMMAKARANLEAKGLVRPKVAEQEI